VDLPPAVQSALALSLTQNAPAAEKPAPAAEAAATPTSLREQVLDGWRRWSADQTANLTTSRAAFLAAFQERTGHTVSERSLRRWEREAKAAPERAAQGPSRGAPIPRVARELFEALYLDQGKPTIRHCYRIVATRMKRQGVAIPSYDTFRRHAMALDPAVVTLARDGAKALEQRHGRYIERNVSTLAPNDVWVGDHHRLDILCRGSKPGQVTRPWLTAWLDMASRKLMGWLVFAGDPCSDTILLAFRRGCAAHGVPRGVYVDNGQDYRSEAVTGAGPLGKRAAAGPSADFTLARSVMGRLQLDTTFALPFNARAKAIERFFETVKDQFCRLWPSFVGGSPGEKPERMDRVAWESLPTTDEVRARLEQWVPRYCAEPHRALGNASPAAAWASRLETQRMLPDWAMRLCCMRSTRPVKVGRQGVVLLGTHYWAPELASLWGRTVVLRYDPADASEVHLYDTKERWLATAKNQVALEHGASSEQLRAALAERRAQLRAVKKAREAYGKLSQGESALDAYLNEPLPPEPKPAAVTELIAARIPERPRTQETSKQGDAEASAGALVSALDFLERREQRDSGPTLADFLDAACATPVARREVW
jgi:hypothetical protein